jgi:hypothetical protein
MNSSLQRILKNASGMKEPFRPTFKTELEDILDEGDGPDDDNYLEACAQVEGASVKDTMKPDLCKSEKSEQSAGAWNAQEAFQKWKPMQTQSPAKRLKPSGPRSQSSPRGQTWVSGHSRRMSR